jgi:uncharacterized protein YjbI with pentapeptide repeats
VTPRDGRGSGRRPPPASSIELTDLVPFAGDALEARQDYEAVELVGLDLGRQHAENAGLLRCRLARCGLDELALPKARLSECLLTECHGSSVDLSESIVRDTLVADGRFGVLSAPRSTWSGTRLRGGKIDLLDLSLGRLSDLALEGCSIAILDLTGARLRAATFQRCEIGELVLDDARLADVDLAGAELRLIRGIAQLRGATIARSQLLDLAPQLAAHLGLTVSDD